MSLLRLMPGKAQADVLRFLHHPVGPPPFTDGGIATMAPGRSGYVALNLAPGQYVAICFIPDRYSSKPHYDLGMIRQFAVGMP